MGTDKDAVEAGPGSESMTRANGDGSAFANDVAPVTGATWTSDVNEVAGLDGPEEPEAATSEVVSETDELRLGSGSDPEYPSVGEREEFAEPAVTEDQDKLDEPAAEMDLGLEPLDSPREMSQMVFVDVVLLLPATHPVVVLQEADAPFRELRIPVGGAEGIAISYAARGLATPRPLTHELFTRVLEEFGMTLDVVRITEVRGTAFTAEMVISGRLGTRLIDCRPSDAIALALRHRLPVPIMVEPTVLEVAGTDPMGAN
ncbi:MAG: bifunctional nuclease family protein [Acidimicrobiales bacterium]